MTLIIQRKADIDNLKKTLVNSASYKEKMASFWSNEALKGKLIILGFIGVIITPMLTYYLTKGIFQTDESLSGMLSMVVAIVSMITVMLLYTCITGFDFDEFSAEFFEQNEGVIESSFCEGLESIDELYIDPGLNDAIRVKLTDADIITTSKDTYDNAMTVYCVVKVEEIAIKVKKLVRLSRLSNGRIDLTVSDYLLSRLSEADLVDEYKNNPDIYQAHFS